MTGVSFGANTVLADSGAGNITFNSTIDGPFTLQVNTFGDEVFNGAVGKGAPLASLTTDGAGPWVDMPTSTCRARRAVRV